MSFHYSRHNLSPREERLERFFEILPGFSSWFVLLGMIVLSFWKPVAAAIIMIVFNFYWLLRMFYITIFVSLSYFRLSLEAKTDWMARVAALDGFLKHGSLDVPRVQGWNFKKRISSWIYRRQIAAFKKMPVTPPLSSDITHLVIVPAVKETREVLEPGVKQIAEGSYPASRIVMILAVEERSLKEVKDGAEALKAQYGSRFADFLVVYHPSGLPGESRVKGANITFAARRAAEYFFERGTAFENVVVSCFDSDTVVSHDYFACLTYAFMICPDRYRASFQPIPVYHNNIWDVPGFARVLETGASLFQLTEATDPDKLVTFSSHSMSFKALVEVGYWPVDMISDDSAIFWKSLLHYKGDYRAVPMYITVSMDVIDAGNIFKTAGSVYKQKRRWAWGVENFPIVMRGFLRTPGIPLRDKIHHGFKLFEGHLAWATWPFILAVIGWMPALFAGREFAGTVLYYSAPRISGTIFNLAMLSLVTTIILSFCLLPKSTSKRSFFVRAIHAFEWLLVPPIMILFSALPALDAQTRLMLGRYLDFWVSEKKRPQKG